MAKKKQNSERKMTRKERKRLQKEQEKEQRELEKKLVAEGKLKPRVKYERRSFLWNALAVSLAFLLGIGAGIGGLVGGGYIAGTKFSLKDVLSAFNFNYSEVLSEESANLSLVDLAKQVMEDLPPENLNAIGKYTPLLKKQLDNVSGQLGELGVKIDTDELMTVPLSDLGSYFQENVIKTVELGAALGLTPESDAIMLAVCYGAEGEDYDVTDGKIVMREGKTATTVGMLTEDATGILNDIEVETLLSVTAQSNSTMRYFAYGSENEQYKIVWDGEGNGRVEMLNDPATGELYPKKKVGDLTADDADLLGGAKIGDMVAVDDNSSSLLRTVKDWTIDEFRQQHRIERLKIGQVLNADENPSRLIAAISDWRLKDISRQEKIDSLVLGDILTITQGGGENASPKILQSLADTPLGEFGDAIDAMPLTDMLGDVSDNKLLKHLGYSTVNTLSDDISALTADQVYGDEIYSYKTGDTKDGRPEGVVKDVSAVTKTYTANGSTVTPAYFVKTENGGYASLSEGLSVRTDAEIARANRAEGATWQTPYFTEERVPVTAVFEYKKFNYDTGLSEPLSAEEKTYEIKQDSNGEYYFNDGNGKRTDLDREITFTDGNGTEVSARVYGNEQDGYYVKERREVFERYADTDGNTYSESQVTAVYRNAEGEEVTRYLAGAWYLLFEDVETCENTPLLDMADLVTNAAAKIDEMTLGELYVHELIASDPSADIGKLNYNGHTNLNELTLGEAIDLIKQQGNG